MMKMILKSVCDVVSRAVDSPNKPVPFQLVPCMAHQKAMFELKFQWVVGHACRREVQIIQIGQCLVRRVENSPFSRWRMAMGLWNGFFCDFQLILELWSDGGQVGAVGLDSVQRCDADTANRGFPRYSRKTAQLCDLLVEEKKAQRLMMC